MRSIKHNLMAVVGLALVAGCGTSMAADQASTGLGQSWPNATDVSASADFHVYVFEHLGVRYVQVNDAGGNVRGAVAYGGSDILSLPVGADADRWVTPSEGTWNAAAMASGQQVYADEQVNVTAAPQPDGTMRLLAEPVDCKNPAECSVPGP